LALDTPSCQSREENEFFHIKLQST
jgi:hypothetical protein